MSEIPRGWMDAETARAHARRGVWCWKNHDDIPGGACMPSAESMVKAVYPGESWMWIAPHPDDEPAAGTVEPSPDPVALVLSALRAADTIVMGRGRGDETTTEIAALLIEAGFRPPTPEAVETVRGVCRE